MSTNGKVLIVEDRPDVCESLQSVLELDGYDAVITHTVGETLRDAMAWNDCVAVILDNQLPDGTAEELIPDLNRIAPKAVILVVTGFVEVEGALAAIRAGAKDVLLKPFKPQVLLSTLDRIIQQRLIELNKVELPIREQHRVAAKLQEAVEQNLQNIKLEAEALSKQLATANNAHASDVDRLRKKLADFQDQLDYSCQRLLPVNIDASQLPTALSNLAADTQKRFGIECACACPASVTISDSSASEVFRIAQDAIRETAEDANAHKMTLQLDQGNEFVLLELVHDGQGAPADSSLEIMHMRAAAIGGELSISKETAGVTRLTCSLKIRDAKQLG